MLARQGCWLQLSWWIHGPVLHICCAVRESETTWISAYTQATCQICVQMLVILPGTLLLGIRAVWKTCTKRTTIWTIAAQA